jgi:hypothetical protein
MYFLFLLIDLFFVSCCIYVFITTLLARSLSGTWCKCLHCKFPLEIHIQQDHPQVSDSYAAGLLRTERFSIDPAETGEGRRPTGAAAQVLLGKRTRTRQTTANNTNQKPKAEGDQILNRGQALVELSVPST